MSLKSEIVVDKVSPLGGLFEVKGKLQIKKQDDDRPIFEIDPNTGTISNDGFILSNNDLDIPVFTFKDKNGFSILTDLTTETLSGRNNPNKGIKFQSNRSTLPITGPTNTVTIGNIADGLGSIIVNSDDQVNYKETNDYIRLFSSNIIMKAQNGALFTPTTGSTDFQVIKVSNKTSKRPHSNVIIGGSRTLRNQIYTGTNAKYDGSTRFLGSGSRTIIKNQFEVLQKTHFRGDVKIGVGSIDNFGAEAQTKFTHFTNFFSELEEQEFSGTSTVTEVFILDEYTWGSSDDYYQTFYEANGGAAAYGDNFSSQLQTLFDANIANGGNGFDGLPTWAVTDTTGLDENALLLNFDVWPTVPLSAGFVEVAGESFTGLVPTGPGTLNPSSKGQLTILAGKSSGIPGDGVTDNGWLHSASLGHYGSDLSASLADESFILHTNPNDANAGFVSANDVGRDNQPAIKSKGSLTVLIDTDNDPEGRFFEVISGIPSIDFHSNSDNKSLLVITPSDERTAVKHLSSSGDLFASTSLSTNESNASSHKLIVVDTASGKFFHKDADALNSFLTLPDTPDAYSTEETVEIIGDSVVSIPGTNFNSHSLVVNVDPSSGEGSIQFIQTVHSASHAVTASHFLGEIAGVGFPYAGSDNLAGDPAQAVITGSLLLSGSGNITASNISASTIIATSFTGSLSGSITNATSASLAETASFYEGSVISASLAETASFYGGSVISASLAETASFYGGSVISASLAETASYISVDNIDGTITATNATTAISGGSIIEPFHIVNDGFVGGDLTISGALGVGESITLADVTFSSSADAFTFGSGSDNTITHQMTGNLAISASTGITANMSANTVGFHGTASFALNASSSISSSLAETASFYGGSVISASLAETASLAMNANSASNATNAVSASLAETASLAINANSASNADTASYIAATNVDGQIGFPFTGSASITGSLAVTESISVQTTLQNVVGVFATASHAENAISASYISGGVMSGSLFGTASHAVTASYINAANIDGQPGFPFTGSATISGSLNIEGQNGSITASGNISASAITASSFTGSFTGSLSGTATSASHAETASFYGGSVISASLAETASYVDAGNIDGSVTSASFADSSSLATFAESITNNTMLLTQLKDIPDNGGAFEESNDNGYPPSHEGFALIVSGNNQEMEFVQTVPSASVAVSASTSITASHAITASFALNTTPSPTAFTSLTDVFGTDVDGDGNGDTAAVPYANIAWGPGSNIIYTTAHTGSFTGSFDGILTGTSSHAKSSSNATNAISASLAETASYIAANNIDGQVGFPFTGSAQITGSLEITGSGLYVSTSPNTIGVYATSSHAATSSVALNALSASYLSSFLDIDDTPDVYDNAGQHIVQVKNDLSGLEFVQTVQSASLAETASFFSGSVENATSASLAETASFYGGSVISASLAETASFYEGSVISASHAETASFTISASLAETASLTISASLAETASYISSSNIDGDITATNATTAMSGGSDTEPFHVVNDAFVSGNLVVCGSLGVATSVTLDDVILEASSDAFIFGHNAANTIIHQMTGNLELSASTGITVNMSDNTVGFHGTASHAKSASNAINALTASYIDLNNVDGTFNPFPFTGSAQISGNLSIDGENGSITSSQGISASGQIIATSLQIDNAQSITALDSEGTAQDIAFITNGNILTFGDNDLDTTILGDDIILDSSNGITIDSDNGQVLFQDGGVTSITFNTTNGAITASNISASSYSSSLSSGVGFHGTASYALTANLTISSSHAETASFFSGSVISASFAETASFYGGSVISASFADSSSLAANADSASNATNAISASLAETASLTISSSHAETASFAATASFTISSSLAETASLTISSSHAESASLAANAITASYLESFKLIGDTPDDYAGFASHSVVVNSNANGLEFVSIVQSASNAVNALSASFAETASYIEVDNIEGDLVTTFTALTDTNVPAGTAEDPYTNNDVIIVHNNELIMTGSVPLATTADTASHFTGTVISASFADSSSLAATSSLAFTASLTISSSHAETASFFAGSVISASFADSSSLAATSSLAFTASLTISSSHAETASFFSGSVISASHAETASHALSSNPFPFTGFAAITGSLDLIGSITTQSNAIQNNLEDNTYVTSNIQPNSAYPLFRMFNNVTGSTPSTTTSTLWVNSLTSDLLVDYNIHGKLGISPVIDRLGLMFNTEGGEVGSYNRQIQISGSNDGTIWTPLAQEAYPSTQPSRSFAFNNINPYKRYRFRFPSDQNFRSDNQESSLYLGIEEIFLYSDQGSVTANNFYGPLVGTASYALTASLAHLAVSSSHAETASLATTASFTISASLAETASLTISSSHAETASLTISSSHAETASFTISASLAETASLTISSSLAETASLTISSSHAETASFTISASLAETASFTISASLAETASYALLASQSENIKVSLSSAEADNPIIFSLDTTPAGEFVGVHADPSMSYNAFTDTFNVPQISATDITASGTISASVFSSSTTNAVGFFGTASFALTASHALNTPAGVGFPYAGSDTLGGDPAQAVITGSLFLSGSGHITASGHISASAVTASSFSGSFTGSLSGSITNATSASFAETASLAVLAISGGSVAQPFHIVNDAFVSGTLFVSGNIATAESITIHDVTISQSADAFVFGSSSLPTVLHQMTGSLSITASHGIIYTGSGVGFHGTASHAESSSHASFASESISSSFAETASFTISASLAETASLTISSSFTETASFTISASLAETASFYGGSVISASFAETASFYGGSVISASHAETASFYGGSVISASLAETASLAATASFTISASLAETASFYGGSVISASFADSSSLAATASFTISASLAETASYVDIGDIEGDLVTTYLELTDTLDTDFTSKDGFVPVVSESDSKLVLRQTVPSASFAITASHALTSATTADTSTTSEFANTAGAVDLQLATSRHRIALTDTEGYDETGEKIFSPGIEQFVHDADKGSTGLGFGNDLAAGTIYEDLFGNVNQQKGPHYRLELSNFIRIHGDIDEQRPYRVLRVDNLGLNPIELPVPAELGKKYSDVAMVLSGRARSIYSATNIGVTETLDPLKTLDTDLVRMISYTSKGILAVGKSYQLNNGLNLHAGVGGQIRFYTELGTPDSLGGVEDESGPVGLIINKERARNDNQGSTSVKGKLSVGHGPLGASTLAFPTDVQFIVHNPNNVTQTDTSGLLPPFSNPVQFTNGGNSFGIQCTSTLSYRGLITLADEAIKFSWTTHPTISQPYVIQSRKNGVNYPGGGVNDGSFIKDGVRFFMDNKNGNLTLPANHGATDVEGEQMNTSAFYSKFKSPFKMFIEGTDGAHSIEHSSDVITSLSTEFNDNAQGSNFLDTGKALHVNNGISHFGGSTIIGSPFRRMTNSELAFLNSQISAGNNPQGIYGEVTSSTTGEPLYTVNSSSFNPGDYYGVNPGVFSPTVQIAGNFVDGNAHAIPLHSMGGEFFHNSVEYAINNTTLPSPFGQSLLTRTDRSPATDPKLFVNGVSYRAFNNRNAIRAIGVTSLESTEYDAPSSGIHAYQALNITGSMGVRGASASFDARTYHLQNAHFHNIYLDEGTFYHLAGNVEIQNGNIEVPNGNVFVGTPSEAVLTESDRKLKQNIVDLDSQLDNIKALQPREYEWKKNNKKDKGFIAQELQEIYPSLVKEHKDTLHVGYTGLIPILVKGMQEQQEMIEKLTAKINELEKKIDK